MTPSIRSVPSSPSSPFASHSIRSARTRGLASLHRVPLGILSQRERTTVDASDGWEVHATRSMVGKKWVRKEWREERVEVDWVTFARRLCAKKGGSKSQSAPISLPN